MPDASSRSLATILGIVLLFVLSACGGPRDPTRGIATLRIVPGAVLLTEEGAVREVRVRAYDARGNERPLDDVALDWEGTDETTVELTVPPDDPTRVRLEALASPGSSVVTVRIAGHPDLVAEPAPVTVAALTEGTRAVPDARIVFPFPHVPPGATPSTYVPPHVELGGSEATLGAFSESEVGALFEETPDGGLRTGAVLVDDGSAPPRPGDRLVSAGGAGLMGEVTSVETRDGYALVQLDPVSLQDVYERLVFRYDGPDLADRGLSPSPPASAADEGTLAGAATRCKPEGNLTGVHVRTPLPTLTFELDPDVAIDTATDAYRVALTFTADLTMAPGFDLQPGLVGKLVCELGDPYAATWALPGPLAAIMGVSTKLQPTFEASADFSIGPRLDGDATLGAGFGFTVGFDTSLEGDSSSLNSAEGSLRGDLSGAAEWSLRDDLRGQLAGKLTAVGKGGVQFGGIAATKAAEWSAWIPVLGGYAQAAADALNLDLIELEIGPVLSVVWESSKRVLNQDGSNGTVALDAIGTLNLQSEALNAVLEKFEHGPLKFNLVDIKFPLGTLFRVFDDDEIEARTESFAGKVQDAPIPARVGETAEFRARVQYKGASLLFGEDRPLTDGELWLGESAYLGPPSSVDAAAQELLFEVPITEEVCDAGLSFLAINDKGGIDFPGYAGFVELACDEGATHTVQVEPPTSGRVVSEPAGIDCGGDATDCSRSWPAGTTVALTAIPDDGYRLESWTGACSGGEDCVLTLDRDVTVGAVFAPDDGGDVIPLGVRVGPMTGLEGVTLVVAPDTEGSGLRTGSLAPAFADADASHVAAFAGADGYALVDLVSGATVGGDQELAGRGPFFGVAAASQDPPGADATAMIVAFGLNGWALDVYDPATDAWSARATPNDAADPVTYDAVPAGGGLVSDLVPFVQPGDGVRFLQWTPDGFGGGDYDPVDALELDALRYASTSGELVSAWLADDSTSPAPALVLVRDVDSRLYLEPRDGSPPTAMTDGLGLDARKLRCAGVGADAWLCGVTVFGDDGLAIVAWDGSSVPTLEDVAPVGDGPVGLDLRVLADGDVAFVTTGFGDGTVSESEVAPDGTVLATDTRAVPSGCVQPGHAAYVRDAVGLKLVVTCYGSGNYAVMDSVF